MNHAQDLITVISLILIAAAIIHIRQKEVLGEILTAIAAGVAGFGTGAVIVTATATTGLRHLIQDANWGGVNVALTLTVWAALIGYYEAFARAKQGGEYKSHYLRTPLIVFLALMFLPLWNLHGMSVTGLGVLLGGVAVILAVKNRGETRRLTTILAIIAGAMLALAASSLLGAVTHYSLFGVGIPLVLAILFALIIYLQVFHKEQRKYHHYRTPAMSVAFGLCLALTFTGVIGKALHWGTKGTVSTVAHITPAGSHGGDDNPFAILDQHMVSSIPGGHSGHRG